MGHYTAIDVSLKLSSVCVVDASGKIVHEMKAASDPEALVALFRKCQCALNRILGLTMNQRIGHADFP
jgi:transposase